jgi:guanosine-3',5'-bis(diphosphate) 3'-pyrophosphohydrolase
VNLILSRYMLAQVPQGTTQTEQAQPAFVARSDLVATAYEMAASAHQGQRRKDDGSPYITHPVTVAGLLHDAGFDDDLIAAALLHDVVEDTDMDSDELSERFGERVAELVDALSEDEGIQDYEERKREHREQVEEAASDAIAIYIADKLSNLRDMRRIYAEEGEAIASRFKAPLDVRVRLWKEDAEMAERAAPDLPFLPDFRRELAEFDRQRARRAAAERG